MEITKSNKIPEVVKIKPITYEDNRGEFLELYSIKNYNFLPAETKFLQDNISISKKNVLRGLHYQIEHPQGKLVTCLNGYIFDVAVDLRKNSKTFGQWTGFYLDGHHKEQIWIPEGFAHGFYTVTSNATIVYKNTDIYHKENERTLLWNDININIFWGSTIMKPILSEKDKLGKSFTELLEEL